MKILIIGPSWIGDMMMSQSLYSLLTQRYPGVQIDVMAPPWSLPLLQRMPEVNRVLAMPFGHGALALGERYKLGYSLRKENYNQAFILPNSFKSALIPFFANISQRTGWCGEFRYGLLNDIRMLDKKAFRLMVQRYAALAFDRRVMHSAEDFPLPPPWPRLVVSEKDREEAWDTFARASARPLIGFCPGAEFGPAKRWPHYHYATLAKTLIRRGYQIVIFGSTKDQEVGEAISVDLPVDCSRYCRNLAGKTSLDQAVTLISSCEGIISNDSGLMHIASALDRPLIALYGPSSPDFTPPLSQKARAIRRVSGYRKIRMGDQEHGYHQSLIAIRPDQLLIELETLLPSPRDSLCKF